MSTVTQSKSLIDAVRAAVIALSEITGLSQSEILDSATSDHTPYQVTTMLWKILEEYGSATPNDLAKLFGQPLQRVHDGLIRAEDQRIYTWILNRIRESSHGKDKAVGLDSTRWKERALEAEEQNINLLSELEMVRKIAADGGSWDMISEYLGNDD